MKSFAPIGLASVLISGCAGSEINPAGTTHVTGVLCGAPFELHDGKERGEIMLEVTCADGSTATLTSSESMAFTGQAQAQADQARMLELVNRLAFGTVGAVVRGPASRQLPPPLIQQENPDRQ